MEDSGGTLVGDNSLLKTEMELGYDYNIYTIPSVLVNQMKVFGSITVSTQYASVAPVAPMATTKHHHGR